MRAREEGTTVAWKKPSEGLVARFHAALPRDRRSESRKMFGFPAAFVNGNMFTGLHEERMILRLSETDRASLAAKGAKAFEPMAGRPMKEYLVVPGSVLEDSASLVDWTARAFSYASGLPPKEKKAAKAKGEKKEKKAAPSSPGKKRG